VKGVRENSERERRDSNRDLRPVGSPTYHDRPRLPWSTTPSGVTPTVLARGTYDAFKVKSSPSPPVDFKAKAKSPIDMVVRKHDYAWILDARSGASRRERLIWESAMM
jgi:hypothetical protein